MSTPSPKASDTQPPIPAPSTHPTPTHLPPYAIYKPNSRGSGAVVRFELNPAKAAVFVNAAPQCGEKQFNWEQKLAMKWTLPDLGTVIAVLENRIPQAKLFHQTERANSILELLTRDDPQRAPLILTLSRLDASSRELRKLTIPVTHSEAAILEIIFKSAVSRILGW